MKRIYLLCILLLVFSTTAVSAFELDLDELFKEIAAGSRGEY